MQTVALVDRKRDRPSIIIIIVNDNIIVLYLSTIIILDSFNPLNQMKRLGERMQISWRAALVCDSRKFIFLIAHCA